MILPDDILLEIRALSKPRMRFIHEFNAGCRDLRFTTDFIPDVKKKLSTKDAPEIIELFMRYVEADINYNAAYRRNIQFIKDAQDTRGPFVRSVEVKAACQRALCVGLYGEEAVAREEASLMEIYD